VDGIGAGQDTAARGQHALQELADSRGERHGSAHLPDLQQLVAAEDAVSET